MDARYLMPEIRDECIAGLIKASKNYEPAKAKFSTYAVKCMDNQVKMWLRKRKRRLNPLKFSETKLKNSKGDNIPLEERTDDLQVEDESQILVDSMWLEEELLKLNKIDYIIIHSYYFEGLNQQEISDKIGYSQPYVSRKIKDITNRLKKNYLKRVAK